MSSSLKLSIITACYNSRATIADTIQSIKEQTYTNIESVFIDGGSNDGTAEYIQEHKPEGAVLISEPDSGLYDAMNKGLKMATGDVIGLLNSDDFYPEKSVLETIVPFFSDPKTDACYGDLRYVHKMNTDKIIRLWKSESFKPGLFKTGWVPPHPTFYARRSVYQKYGYFDLDYKIAADYEFLLRMFEVNRINAAYIPRVLVHMRLGGETNKSIRNIVNQNREIWQALKKHGLDPAFWNFFTSKARQRFSQYVKK